VFIPDGFAYARGCARCVVPNVVWLCAAAAPFACCAGPLALLRRGVGLEIAAHTTLIRPFFFQPVTHAQAIVVISKLPMELVAEYSFFVRSYETDERARLKPHAVFNYFEHAAWLHAESLGFGYSDLTSGGRLWVLSRVDLQFDHYPAWGDTLTFRTWPRGVSGPFAQRDLLITDEQGRVRVRGTSAWIILDQQTRRPVRPTELIDPAVIDTSHIEPAVEAMPAKISRPDTMAKFASRRTAYADIDVNQHVNNAEFVRWCMDLVPGAFLRERPARRLQANFLAEAHEDTQVTFFASQNPSSLNAAAESQELVLEVRRESDEKELFRARVTF